MSRILLTNTYFYPLDKKQWKAKTPYPPLGTLYAASVLRKAGHEVEVFDNCLKNSTMEFKSHLESNSYDLVVVYDDGFNYLTKMCLTVMRDAAFEMASYSRAHGMKTVISSSDSTDHYKLYIENGFDVVILGEGEDSLIELPQAFADSNFGEVSGIAYKDKKEFLKNEKRAIIRDLDLIPDPAWDLIDIQPYKDIWLKFQGYFSINISTTRGCPYKCNWCAKPIYGNRYNSRSPQRVVNEMEYLTDTFGADQFWITDDIFGLKPGWVQEFRDFVKEKNRKFRYKIQSRADLMLKDSNVDAMIESGMAEVWIGAESGSQKILDAMDKGITVEQIREVTRKVQSKNGKICFFLQFGYLGEEIDDIEKTVDLLLELMPDDIGISVSYPLPGTGFYEKVKSQLAEKANWSDSDDLDVMYNARYDKKFYKKLHRRVHKLYRRKQGLMHFRQLLNSFPSLKGIKLKAIVLSLFYYSPFLWMSRKLSEPSS